MEEYGTVRERQKNKDDNLFDRIDASSLNDYLRS